MNVTVPISMPEELLDRIRKRVSASEKGNRSEIICTLIELGLGTPEDTDSAAGDPVAAV